MDSSKASPRPSLEQALKQTSPCPEQAKKRHVSTPGHQGPQVKKTPKEWSSSPIKPHVLFLNEETRGETREVWHGEDLLIQPGETTEDYIARMDRAEAVAIAEDRAFNKKFPVLVDPLPNDAVLL